MDSTRSNKQLTSVDSESVVINNYENQCSNRNNEDIGTDNTTVDTNDKTYNTNSTLTINTNVSNTGVSIPSLKLPFMQDKEDYSEPIETGTIGGQNLKVFIRVRPAVDRELDSESQFRPVVSYIFN